MTDLCQLPAHTLVALMVGSEVSCREVVAASSRSQISPT